MSEFTLGNLMDLATMDTSDLTAQVSRLSREGIYIIDLTELGFTEQAPKDAADPMNYTLGIKGTILAWQALSEEKAGDTKPEDMEGKDLSERYFLFGKDIREAIQLLMGRFKQTGFRHKGVMGGVEGAPAGWINEAIGKRVAVRVSHYKAKDEQERARYDWLSPKQLEKLGIDWAVLQRDYCDELGNPVAIAA